MFRSFERQRRIVIRTLAFTALFILSISNASASGFIDQLYDAVENHDRVKAARLSTEATRQRVRVSKGGFFPKLNLKASAGREHINNPSSPNTSLNFSNASAEVTQLIWDFGATYSKVEKAKLRLARAELGVLQTRQDVMFQAIRAALQVQRAQAVLDHANRSEASVRRQTGLEEAKVKSGGGYSTDVLQAKTQLAAAKTRSMHAQRAKKIALNSYRRFFRGQKPNTKSMRVLVSVLRELPPTPEDALKIAARLNTKVQIAHIDEAVAKATVKQTRRSEFLPKLDLVGKSEYSNNVSGTAGIKESSSIKFQLSMPFNLGFTSVNKLNAGQRELEAAAHKVTDARLQVEEEVLNAWVKYETARSSAVLLQDQADLAKGFLELAKQEREMGNRSLIDVLSGETAHISALSDALAAQTDVLLAAFEILKATGQLALKEDDILQPKHPLPRAKVPNRQRTNKVSSKKDVWTNLR